MADKKKDPTPPPLLLMQPSGGLTLSPASGTSLLMPVPAVDSSLMAPEEEGEADSFVGQTPAQVTPFPYFQQPPAATISDPFAAIGQQSSPAPAPAPLQAPTPSSVNTSIPAPSPLPAHLATPPRAPGQNMYRMSGPARYARPPPGHYSHMGGAPPLPNPVSTMPSQPGAPPMMTSSAPFQPPSFPPTLHSGSVPQPMGPSTMAEYTPSSTDSYMTSPPAAPPSSTNQIATLPTVMPGAGAQIGGIYIAVQHHWFYSQHVELRTMWYPFTMTDSIRLEEARKTAHQDSVIVSVQGGRYDVDVIKLTRNAVYWEEGETSVRRCSWFFKADGDFRFVPYEEEFADRLEAEYRMAVETNVWHKPLEFPGGETIIMHSPSVIVHFQSTSKPDEWGTTQGDQSRPKVVRRGIDDFNDIEDGEPDQIDHLVFVVHGIGSTCDLRFRNIVECVDDFRSISLQLMKSHFGHYQSEGRIGRVEFLPVRWHSALHGDATGIDKRLRAITLNSIGKLRHFTNDTLLDILFYASPTYCQQIADTVGGEINRLFSLFLSRNQNFKGQASVAGHSLGSLIIFDLLTHQREEGAVEADQVKPVDKELNSSRETTPRPEELNGSVHEERASEGEPEDTSTLEQLLNRLSLSEYLGNLQKEQMDMETLSMCEDSDLKEMGIPLGPRKKLQGYLKLRRSRQSKRKQEEERKAQLAQARQIQEEAEQRLREQSQAAVQQAVVNGLEQVPSDPDRDPLLRQASSTSVDYVVGSAGTGIPFVKYPQLDFHPTNFFALGSPVAMFITVRGAETLGEEFRFPTCSGFFNIFHPFDPVAYRIEPLITQTYPAKPVLMPHHKGRKRLHLELKESLTRMGADIKQRIVDSVKLTWKTINDFAMAHRSTSQEVVEQEVDNVIHEMAAADDENAETGSIASSMMEDEDNTPVGHLNQGRRIDYVLQEKPIESFNDYLFALGSHACYWESEDTVLLILKEIYAVMGIAPIRPGTDALSPIASPPQLYSLPASPGNSPHHFTPGGASPASFAPPVSHPTPPMHGQYVPPPPSTGFSHAPTSNFGPPPLTGFVRTSTQ